MLADYPGSFTGIYRRSSGVPNALIIAQCSGLYYWVYLIRLNKFLDLDTINNLSF